MGKYSNVNVSGLNSEITKLQELVNTKTDFLTSISSYKSGAIKNIKAALTKMNGSSVSGSIGNLKTKLTSLKAISDKIAEYQKIEKNIKDLEPSLYKWVDNGYYKKNEDGSFALDNNNNKIWIRNMQQVVDQSVLNKITALQNNLSNLEKRIDKM